MNDVPLNIELMNKKNANSIVDDEDKLFRPSCYNAIVIMTTTIIII